MWTVQGTRLHTITDHSNWIYGLAVHPIDNVFASASDDCTVRVWDKSTYACLAVIQCGAIVECVRFGPAQDTIITALAYGHVTAYDMRTHEVVRRYSRHAASEYVYGLALSPYNAAADCGLVHHARAGLLMSC